MGKPTTLNLYNLYSVSLTASHNITILQNTYTNHTIIYSLSTSQFSSSAILTAQRTNEELKHHTSSFSSFKKKHHDYTNATM